MGVAEPNRTSAARVGKMARRYIVEIARYISVAKDGDLSRDPEKCREWLALSEAQSGWWDEVGGGLLEVVYMTSTDERLLLRQTANRITW